MLAFFVFNGVFSFYFLSFFFICCRFIQTGKVERRQFKQQQLPFAKPKLALVHHRYALTLGEQAEIRVGSTLIGRGLAVRGLSVAELRALAEKLTQDGVI